ncbi:insulinase family protein [Sediminibacterium roseum]|uniref:Insulinase family protein n=1 Tax=Sediminibacterium roseum TaxID=1978412 RepID=A0ABW9ZUB8_9BACT|nr:pitrilysin family protein [Sediminibacterium roseum]NCI50604.1 insulinase family protein [Sediminibacterium roseum]
MKKWISVTLAASLFSGGLLAQAPKIVFEKYTLPNGLTVILHQDKSAPVVAVSALYHVGSKNEDTARTGFAHFFEHLMFEGSDNVKRGDFDKYTSNAGGYNNANTSQDRTYYFELFPSNQYALGLWLESERMLHAKIEDVGVNTQKEVVKEEKRQRIDNQPYGTIIGEIFKRAYKEHPYKWQPIGSLEHLSRAKLSDFVDFYKTFYVPNNCVLSLAGDIDIPEVKKKIQDYFGSIPAGTKPIPRPSFTEAALGGEVRDVIEDNIQLPAVIQAYRSPKQGSEEYYAFNVLQTILSGGNSSRLNKAIVDQKQLAVQAGAFNYALEDAGLFITFGIANMNVKPEDLEKEIQVVIDGVKENLVGEKEFTKVKNQITTDFVNKNSSMAGIAETLANYQVYFGDANLINTEIDRYNKVTREDVLKVAKKYLNKDNRVTLYYVAKGSKK